MAGVVGILILLTVLFLSLVITRVATVVLTMTGLSEETARFQARSAFTGTGFTTSESEHVVQHPIRRRVIMALMILRSAGLITIIISLMLSFLGPSPEMVKVMRLLWLSFGVLVLWLLARSKTVERYMCRVIERALKRWTDLDVRDYASLLRLSGGYSVTEIHVREGDWVAGKKLRECYLPQEGITVLGISRSDGSYVGGPKGDTDIYPGDMLIVYGRAEKLRELDARRADRAGDEAHDRAVSEQIRHMREQEDRESRYRKKRQAALESGKL